MKSIISSIIKQTQLSEQEAWWIIEAITKKDKNHLLFIHHQQLTKSEKKTLDEWIKKLTQEQIPLAYLLGFVHFLDLTIKVQSPILIPRPETEEWVALLIKNLEPYKNKALSILDIGTGSGCIALAIAKHFEQAIITATDISQQALDLAKKNAIQNNIKNIKLINSDLFEKLEPASFDIIVTNPPYINQLCTLPAQVYHWEDHQALFATDHGLAIIKKIIKEAPRFLRKPFILPFQLVIEHDYNQHLSIQQFAQIYKINSTCFKDLFGKFRTTWCTFLIKQKEI
ncbi:peptide chain release factor N(5)-glutamine methyltransferase [Candidatus Dependentiae bacterium]|nr:peptide chain release factor N(5)-glutamine methyltransferase [Candidatus Dependentiae bacterium]